METSELQQQLFHQLKDVMPPHLSMVDDLCELLELSPDSVYRRIRGEKPLTLNELKTICQHYKLSLDHLLQLQTESVMFQAPGMNNGHVEHLEYLKGMLGQFRYFNSFKSREVHYLCKDVPFWYFYLFPEIAAFKTFFWSRTINNHPALAQKKFSLAEFPYDDCFHVGQEIIREFNEIPAVELWNLESINSTINQLCFYKDAGLFKSREDLDAVINSFIQTLDHLQAQAEQGVKFMPGMTDVGHRAQVQVFINELILGNNTILLNLDGQRMSIITYSVLSYLITRDERFANKVFNSFNTLLSRSTLVSRTGEKDRNRFFNTLREKVLSIRK